MSYRPYLLYLCLIVALSLCPSCAHVPDDSEDSELSLEPIITIPTDPDELPTISFVLKELAGSAAATPPTFLRRQHENLWLAKHELGTRFVLFASIVKSSKDIEPTLWMDSPLVYFERSGTSLRLMQEQTHVATATQTLPSVLATFPILEESATELRFDFHQGSINYLYAIKRPIMQDATALNKLTLAAPLPAKISGAYFVDDHADDQWFSLIQHISYEHGAGIQSAHIRFTFWRAAASRLEPMPHPRSNDVGYFTVAHTTPRNGKTHIARRWDLSKPLTFYLSANTPAQYRESIRQGILTWNHAFTEPRIFVEDAPANILPGDPRYPMVQWVDDAVGLGIGMTHSHPHTGEILSSLVTISRGWTSVNFEALPTESTSPTQHVAIFGKTSQPLCAYHNDHQLGAVVEWNPQTRDRFSHLQLQSVITHEIGHVLGLRHNFAGSLFSAETHDEQTNIFRNIADGAQAADYPLPSSSIMDYLPALTMLRMHKPGAYDLDAIARLYPEQGLATAMFAGHPFCTDEDVQRFADCTRRDGSNRHIDWWHGAILHNIAQFNADMLSLHKHERSADPMLSATQVTHAMQELQRLAMATEYLALTKLYPYEMRQEAEAALLELFAYPAYDMHPFVSSELAGFIRSVQQASMSNDAAVARSATHRLEQIQRDLRALPAVPKILLQDS